MILLDKIFLKVYLAYRNHFKSDIPITYATSYLVVMFSMHIMAVLKLLNLVGFDTNTEQYSKWQKITVIAIVYFIFGIRYYFFFNPLKFEEKHSVSKNYRPLIIYTAVFFILFWVLILAF